MKLRYIFLAFLLGLSAAVYHFVFDGSIPDESDFILNLAEARTLAAAPANELPTAIHTEILSKTPAPYFALRAGGGFYRVFMARTVFQIMTPQGYYMIEAGMDKALAEMHKQADHFNPEVWGRIQDLLADAKGIMVTHEHPDHIGGIVRHRNPAKLADKLMLTKEQYDGLTRYTDGKTLPGGFRDYTPFSSDQMRRIAPGIVMIPARGHTAGSVIYYIKLASGDEYLFIGDIAYTESNVVDGVDRARFVRWLMVDPEDRDAVINQLGALHDLTKSEPSLTIIPAHADELLARLMSTGVIKEGFSQP